MIQFPPDDPEFLRYLKGYSNADLRTRKTSQVAHRETIRGAAGTSEVCPLTSSHARLLQKLLDRGVDGGGPRLAP